LGWIWGCTVLTTIISDWTTDTFLEYRSAIFHVEGTFLHDAGRFVSNTVAQLARIFWIGGYSGTIGVEQTVNWTSILV